MQTFSSTFREEALLLDGFLRDIDSRNHAINPSRLEKNQTFIPPPSWCTTDDVTNKQTDRQTLKGRGTYRIPRILSVIIDRFIFANSRVATGLFWSYFRSQTWNLRCVPVEGNYHGSTLFFHTGFFFKTQRGSLTKFNFLRWAYQRLKCSTPGHRRTWAPACSLVSVLIFLIPADSQSCLR